MQTPVLQAWFKKDQDYKFQVFMLLITANNSIADGSMCKRTWDGWMCWDDLEAGFTSAQHCPDYYDDFDTSGESHDRFFFYLDH